MLYDLICWVVALAFAFILRFDLSPPPGDSIRALAIIPVVGAAQVACGPLFGLYIRRWAFGSFEEVAALLRTTLCVTSVTFVANLLIDPRLVPRSTPLGAGVAALVVMAGGRYVWRLADERRRRPRGDGCERLLVVGAGEGGTQIIRAMMRNPDSRYIPVALIDDDPQKRNLRIMGVPVVGNRAGITRAAMEFHADALLIAIPSADNRTISEITELAHGVRLAVKILPAVGDLFGDEVGVGDIRDLTAADLLGRHEIRTNIASIAEYLTGRRVLVTGAGGSIGSELCRQINQFAPEELLMLDRDESALHAVQLSILGRAPMDAPNLVLADIRDHATIRSFIASHRPQVIFHAAALKHLPLLERYPSEAVKTNVLATWNLLEAAIEFGVERFVIISTDKAADPCSVLGYTKRVTERLTSALSYRGQTLCLSVRFGNVLGSRGSVLSTFNAQIERGGPLTVTHPDVARFFMTVEEAVELVVQAGAIGRRGEVLVFDMGDPVRIDDLARMLLARSGRPIRVQYTGLRAGEKLRESVFGAAETDDRPLHPLIAHVDVAPLDPAALSALDPDDAPEALIRTLVDLSGAETANYVR